MNQEYQMLTFTDSELNHFSTLLAYLHETEVTSFEEYLSDNFVEYQDFSVDDEDAFELALKDDRVQHILSLIHI